jgi:hypothetical protein
LFLTRFVHSESGLLTSRDLLALSRVSGLVAWPLPLTNPEIGIDPADLNSCLLKATQMIPYNTAICRFYCFRPESKRSAFVDCYFQFPLSYIGLFDKKETQPSAVLCLNAIRFLFWSAVPGNDNSGLTSMCFNHFIGFTISARAAGVMASWSIFRNWRRLDKSVLEALGKTEQFRGAFYRGKWSPRPEFDAFAG